MSKKWPKGPENKEQMEKQPHKSARVCVCVCVSMRVFLYLYITLYTLSALIQPVAMADSHSMLCSF